MQAGLNSLFIFLLILFVVFVWMSACFLIGVFSGWHALSGRFRAQSEPYGGNARSAGPFFYTIYMRFWGHYSSSVRITAGGDGLYLSVLFLFRAGHPPLRIPWEEIQFGRTRFFWRRYIVLTLGAQERIPLRISERMARKLEILERVPEGCRA